MARTPQVAEAGGHVVPFQRKRTLTRALWIGGGLLAAAAAIILVVQLQQTPGIDGIPEFQELVAAVGNEPRG